MPEVVCIWMLEQQPPGSIIPIKWANQACFIFHWFWGLPKLPQVSSRRCAELSRPVWYNNKGEARYWRLCSSLKINIWQKPRQNRYRQRGSAEAVSLEAGGTQHYNSVSGVTVYLVHLLGWNLCLDCGCWVTGCRSQVLVSVSGWSTEIFLHTCGLFLVETETLLKKLNFHFETNQKAHPHFQATSVSHQLSAVEMVIVIVTNTVLLIEQLRWTSDHLWSQYDSAISTVHVASNTTSCYEK